MTIAKLKPLIRILIHPGFALTALVYFLDFIGLISLPHLGDANFAYLNPATITGFSLLLTSGHTFQWANEEDRRTSLEGAKKWKHLCMYALIFSYVGRTPVKKALYGSAVMLLSIPITLMALLAVPLLVLTLPALAFVFIFQDSEIRQYAKYIFYIPYIGFLMLSISRAKDGLDELFPDEGT